MATALTTIDQLAKSIQHSFVAANELILQSSERAADTASAEPDAALQQQAQFIVNNNLGKPPVAIPLALFQSPVRYYLSKLSFDLPCYTITGPRFFTARQRNGAKTMHAFTPTLWQKLIYNCDLYHVIIKVGVNEFSVSFRPASYEEAVLASRKITPPSVPIAWQFRLTPEQEQQVRALPRIIAKPLYWPAFLIRFWHWLTRSKQTVAAENDFKR